MKLSDYAKQVGISYITAYRWYKSGQVKGYQMDTGTIIVTERDIVSKSLKIGVYARVSSSENRANLDSQAERLVSYCSAKGWQVARIIKEIGSGVNDSRPKLIELLQDESITTIVVEQYKSICESFACFEIIEAIMLSRKCKIERIILEAQDDTTG